MTVNYNSLTPHHFVVNVRGINASGKSTMVRKFIELHGDYELLNVEFLPGKFRKVTRFGNNIFVLGDYAQSSPGIDRYNGSYKTDKIGINDIVKLVIKTIISKYNPSCIIFEGAIWSGYTTGAFEMVDMVKPYNYKYVAVCLQREFSQVVELLEKRNVGADYNIKCLYEKYQAVKSATRRLKQNPDVSTIVLDITTAPYEDMGQILAGVVYG